MKYILINLFKRSWGLMLSTSNTWNQIEAEHPDHKQLLKSFFLPWLVICVCIVTAFGMVYNSSSLIKTGVITSLTTLISYGGAYFIARNLSFRFLNKHFPERFTQIQIDKIICYSFTLLFIIRIVISVIPSLFFLKILNIYTIYLVWDACRAILKLDEDERGNFVLLCTSLILFCPFVISKVIEIMLP